MILGVEAVQSRESLRDLGGRVITRTNWFPQPLIFNVLTVAMFT